MHLASTRWSITVAWLGSFTRFGSDCTSECAPANTCVTNWIVRYLHSYPGNRPFLFVYLQEHTVVGAKSWEQKAYRWRLYCMPAWFNARPVEFKGGCFKFILEGDFEIQDDARGTISMEAIRWRLARETRMSYTKSFYIYLRNSSPRCSRVRSQGRLFGCIFGVIVWLKKNKGSKIWYATTCDMYPGVWRTKVENKIAPGCDVSGNPCLDNLDPKFERREGSQEFSSCSSKTKLI